MSILIEDITKNNLVVPICGATGTLMQVRGHKENAFGAPALSSQGYRDLVWVAKMYGESGALAIMSGNWRGKTTDIQKKLGITDTDRLNSLAADSARLAVQAVREGVKDVGHPIAVLASTSPIADDLHPEKTPADEILFDVHRRNIRYLQLARPDAIAFETFGSIRELEVISKLANAAKAAHFITIKVDKKGNMLDGTDLRKVVRVVKSSRLLAFGINCSDFKATALAFENLKKVYDDHIIIKANGPGLPGANLGWDRGHKVDPNNLFEKPGNQEFVSQTLDFGLAGAKYVGGCCGTLPSEIRDLSQKIQVLSTLRAAGAEITDRTTSLPTGSFCACPNHGSPFQPRPVLLTPTK